MDRGDWWAPTVDSVTKSQTRLSDLAHMQPVPLARAAGEAVTGTVAGLGKPAFDSQLSVFFMFHPRLCARSTGVNSVPPSLRVCAVQTVPAATLIPCLAPSTLPGSAGVSLLGVCPSEPLRREPGDRGHPGVPAWKPVRNQRQTRKEGCRIPDAESLIHFLVTATCSAWPYREP